MLLNITFLSTLLSIKVKRVWNLTLVLNFNALRSRIHWQLIKRFRWVHSRHWHRRKAWVWLGVWRGRHKWRIISHHPVKPRVLEEVSALKVVKKTKMKVLCLFYVLSPTEILFPLFVFFLLYFPFQKSGPSCGDDLFKSILWIFAYAIEFRQD